MGATDRICHMLEERGIDYQMHDGGNRVCFYFDYNERCGDFLKSIDVIGECVIASQSYLTPEQAIAATVGRSCASCPEMDNPDSYIMHLHRALEVADEGAGTIEKAAERIEVLSGFAREYLHRYGTLMSMAGEDVTDEVLAMESVINEVCGRKVVGE